MIQVERKKVDGFIEYSKLIEKRVDLMDCLDILQAFYNMTSEGNLIIARTKSGELVELSNLNKPVYEYISLSDCECFSICGWYREERCMLIVTIELNRHRIYIYSSEDIEVDRFFMLLMSSANLLFEKRNLLLEIVSQDKSLIAKARNFGVDSNSVKTILNVCERGLINE